MINSKVIRFLSSYVLWNPKLLKILIEIWFFWKMKRKQMKSKAKKLGKKNGSNVRLKETATEKATEN